MSLLTVDYTFDSDAEGWTLTPPVSDGILQWSSNDGGSIIGNVNGRNKGPENFSLELDTTYGTLGIPSRASITAISLSIDARCSAYNTVDSLYWSATIDSVTRISQVDYTSTSATFSTHSTGSISVSKTDTDSIVINITGTSDCSNDAAAIGQISWDDISLGITYDEHVPQTMIKTWNGSSWVLGGLMKWNGSAWVKTTVKKWSGSEWEVIDNS